MHELRRAKINMAKLHGANWLSVVLYECSTNKAYSVKPHSTIV